MVLLPIAVGAQTLATSLPLLLPSAIAYDSQGNLYIAETANHVVRKVDPAGHITTVAGTGVQGYEGDNEAATSALLDSPQGIAVDAANLYIADTHNHRIREVDLASGIIRTIAGNSTAGSAGDNGLAASATLDRPVAIALDGEGDLFIADAASHRIRKIDAVTKNITTVAGAGTQGYEGDNAQAISALLDSPQGLAVDANGNLYLADTHNQRVRRIDALTGTITTVAGNGVFGYAGDSSAAPSARLALPQGLSVDAAGNLYFADRANHRVRRVDAISGIITTVAGDGTQGFSGDGAAPASAALDNPRSTAVSPSGLVTIADSGNQRVRQITPSSLQTIAGLGTSVPSSLAITGPVEISYGSGHLTAMVTSQSDAMGVVSFIDSSAGGSAPVATVSLSSSAATLDTSSLSAGQHVITASYGGDLSHAAAQSAAFPLTVDPLALTAIVAPASLRYGEEIPKLSGSLRGVLPRDQSSVAAAFSVGVSDHPNAGVYPVAVILTGPAAGNYTLSAAPALTITKAGTATTLSATTSTLVSAANADAGQPVLITVHVVSATTGTPAGTIVLSDGGTLLTAGNATASGDLVFSTSALSSGPHSLVATYSGDANFLPSTSPVTLFTVSTPPPAAADFTLAPNDTATKTIVSGDSASFSFNVQTQGSLSSPITLSATGLPDLATVAFNPGNIPPGTTSATFTMTVTTPKTSALRVRGGGSIAFAALFVPLIVFFGKRSGRTVPQLLLVLLLSVATTLIAGCGDRVYKGDGNSNTTQPPKTYPITVTGTATDAAGNPVRHTATVTLVLQPAS